MDDPATPPEAQAGWRLAHDVQQRLDLFLLPLLVELDTYLDARFWMRAWCAPWWGR